MITSNSKLIDKKQIKNCDVKIYLTPALDENSNLKVYYCIKIKRNNINHRIELYNKLYSDFLTAKDDLTTVMDYINQHIDREMNNS